MNYISEDFRIQYISTYTLYIYTDQIHDQLIVINESNDVILWMSYDGQHPSQEAMKILGFPFHRVYVTLPHQNLTWVPTEVFDRDRMEDFLPFFDQTDPSIILSKDMEGLGVTALYEFDILQMNRWQNIFSQAHFVPVFEIVLKQMQSQIPISGKVLGVHVYGHQIDLYVFVNGAFHFYNTFEATTVDDLSYFVLLVFKHFEIDGQIDKIILSGADLQSAWASCLSGYTADLELAKSKNEWHSLSEDIEGQLYKVGIMVDSALCVS